MVTSGSESDLLYSLKNNDNKVIMYTVSHIAICTSLSKYSTSA